MLRFGQVTNILETHHVKSLYQGSQTINPKTEFGSQMCLAQYWLILFLIYFFKERDGGGAEGRGERESRAGPTPRRGALSQDPETMT